MKTFNVISADVITKTGVEHFIGLTVVVNGKQEQIARTCKQALLDLHKSARATAIPAGLFDNGVASANPILYNKFRETVIGLVGKTGMADVEFYEAGSDYEVTEVSSAYRLGTAKLGDILQTEKKGSRVEGFITFPLTDVEVSRKEAFESIDPMMLINAMLGITNVAPVAHVPVAITAPSPTIDEEVNNAVFGTTAEDFQQEPEPEVTENAPELVPAEANAITQAKAKKQ